MADRVGRAALQRALDGQEQLVLLYQPIHDARSRAIFGAEALLRQRRSNGEIREAAIIHEAAEDSAAADLFRLDHILVQKAYRDATEWPRIAPGIHLNVNLSPREFQEGQVYERLSSLITSCGIDTHLVNIEITETSYIEDPAATMKVLESLKKFGVSLWLDDFGSGHSALTHFQHFPVDGLKIPGAFVSALPHDRKCAAITRAIINLAHDLNIPVIAEEVEREEQLDFLLDLDCDYIQGYLFSKPMDAQDFCELLAGSQRTGSSGGQ